VPAARLVELCSGAGVSAEAVAEPGSAVERARAVARERSGMTLCTGSHYLLNYAGSNPAGEAEASEHGGR
ncbi:MAG TPA: hypothetical protein VE401_02720, partial [Solirubrobacterales bacterium]|nr:hypothetical protein [Solirubrobacterales bacterium]